ncbi:chorismate mutase [Vagococcus entomophilus]|nr:chorismate mutase [Vagococcus entomophilus]
MLENERRKIDQLDQEIIRLLEQRFDTVQTIAKVKKEQSIPILDESREQIILEKVASYVTNKSYVSAIQTIYQEMMSSSRAYQKKQMD